MFKIASHEKNVIILKLSKVCTRQYVTSMFYVHLLPLLINHRGWKLTDDQICVLCSTREFTRTPDDVMTWFPGNSLTSSREKSARAVKREKTGKYHRHKYL